MTDIPLDVLRRELGRLGYRVGQSGAFIHGEEYLGEYTYVSPTGYFAARSDDEQACWLATLEDARNATALTGAKLAAIEEKVHGNLVFFRHDSGGYSVCRGIEPSRHGCGTGTDPDAAINAFWGRVCLGADT